MLRAGFYTLDFGMTPEINLLTATEFYPSGNFKKGSIASTTYFFRLYEEFLDFDNQLLVGEHILDLNPDSSIEFFENGFPRSLWLATPLPEPVRLVVAGTEVGFERRLEFYETGNLRLGYLAVGERVLLETSSGVRKWFEGPVDSWAADKLLKFTIDGRVEEQSNL